MKKAINSSQAPKAFGAYSQAAQGDELIFTSGILPIDPVTGEIFGGDVKSQTELVLKNMENVLKAAGANMKQIVKTTVYLTDLTSFADMNQAYEAFFKDNLPACTTVQVNALPKGSSVSIEAIAHK